MVFEIQGGKFRCYLRNSMAGTIGKHVKKLEITADEVPNRRSGGDKGDPSLAR